MKNVFNISPIYPFLDVLADFVLQSAKKNSLNIADDIILLPTRRACRALKDVFSKFSNGFSLLPKILPLGDVDEDGFAFIDYQNDNLDFLDLPPAIPEVERNLILSFLIKKKSPSLNDQQAFSLALDLAHLMDVVEMEMLDFSNLSNIVPDNLSLYWQETLQFLQIITEWYPKILKERGYLNPVDRKIKLIYKQVDVWQNYHKKGRIFACGSTASLVPISYMINAISNMDYGYVILPHLDRVLSDQDFYNVGQNHPQYGIKNLLLKMQVKRQNVRDLIPSFYVDTAPKDRETLASFIMLNSSLENTWHNMPDLSSDVLQGFSNLILNNESNEALAISFIIRKMIAENKKTLLITPDRKIAKSVASELKRWNISVDDSAGIGASEIDTGNYFILIINAIVDNFSPFSLLALLKHRFSHLSFDKQSLDSLVDDIEIHLLRGNFGLDNIDSIIAKAEELSFSNHDVNFYPILQLLYSIKRIVSPFLSLFDNSSHSASLYDILFEHLKLLEIFVQNNSKNPDFVLNTLYDGDLNSQLSSALKNLLNDLLSLKDDAISKMSLASYKTFISNFLFNLKLRPSIPSHPLVAIMNSIEARLLDADTFILAGLNENTFPSITTDDPWLSRPMKADFKLPLPERKIGLSSHDFVEFFCKKNVISTRALKTDGINTIESRWLQKLDAIINIKNLPFDNSLSSSILSWIKYFDLPPLPSSRIKRPMPKPPLYARPKELWATSIEKLYRDPYIIFASKILSLKKLDDINSDTLPADFGNIVHATLEEFKKKNLSSIEELKQIFIRNLLPFKNIDIIDFWFKRFELISQQFISYEKRFSPLIKHTFTEIVGALKINDYFTLKAKADRIDILNDSSSVIIDYKTGYAPSKKEVYSGYAPQLLLEALILNNNGFPDIPFKTKTSSLTYLQFSSKDNKFFINFDEDIDLLVKKTFETLSLIIEKFNNPDTPYISRPNPNTVGATIENYSEFSHLARVKEWQDA